MKSKGDERTRQTVRDRLKEMGVAGNISRIAQLSVEAGHPASVAIWRDLINNGQAPARESKRWDVCRYLGWTDESLDLLAAGKFPVMLPVAPEPRGVSQSLEARVEEIEEQIRDLQARSKRFDAHLSRHGAASRRKVADGRL